MFQENESKKKMELIVYMINYLSKFRGISQFSQKVWVNHSLMDRKKIHTHTQQKELLPTMKAKDCTKQEM